MKSNNYVLDKPGGAFTVKEETLPELQAGEVLLKTRRTSVCQSDVVIYQVGLPRIKSWPALLLHEVSASVVAVGEGVEKFAVGDLVGIGCDIPCGDRYILILLSIGLLVLPKFIAVPLIIFIYIMLSIIDNIISK